MKNDNCEIGGLDHPLRQKIPRLLWKPAWMLGFNTPPILCPDSYVRETYQDLPPLRCGQQLLI